MRLPTPSRSTWWMGFPALAGAGAALLVPGASGTMSAGASVLAVAALALLAGHAWGMAVLVPSHVALVARVWQALDASGPAPVMAQPLAEGAVVVVLVTAIPTMALVAAALPRMAGRVAGRLLPHHAPRTRATLALLAALLLAGLLVGPAL